MKRTISVLCVGLCAGVAAHFSWYYARTPSADPDLATQLGWMRAVLNLSPEQFSRIKAVHEEDAPRLLMLASELERVRAESAGFEEQRKTVGEVDFLEVARVLKERRSVDQKHDESARHLVAAAMGVMTPDQRRRYLELIAPALKDADREGFQ